MARIRLLAALLLAPLLVGAGEVLPEPDYASDARAIERVVEDNYAYLERFEDGRFPLSDKRRSEAVAVDSREALIRYAERALATLADHHAITASSLADSWALVPSYADLWVEPDFTIGAVRENSPAERAGIRQGDRLVAVAGEPVTEAVAAFWSDLGLAVTPERAGYAARVLAAGRRNAARRLTVAGPGGPRELTLDSLYAARPEGRDPLTVGEAADVLTIRFNDSLGDGATIAAFDAAMRQARPGQPVVLDLRDTPSGGNTTVARAIMGWFVDRPTGYQMHSLPAEEREFGIPRQWIEQVLPRPGMHHDGPAIVKVGRWTGSMGEGLALGLDAMGARVEGGPMAGLLGAVYDFPLENSGLVLKLPAEKLFHIDGTPREAFNPR